MMRIDRESVTRAELEQVQRVVDAAREVAGQYEPHENATDPVLRELVNSVRALLAPAPRYTVGHECVMEDGKIICHTTGTAAAERICAALTVYEQTVRDLAADRMTRDNYARELDRVTRP
jgi:hypothetical protein